jgi:23S rRNA (adenine2030-N6)-methyltransferase
MNYRHAYHAGNFADVVKHAALSRLVEYLKLKDKAFRVVDTHAGAGLYDLSSQEAQKTGEWLDGIGRLLGLTPPASLPDALSPSRGGRVPGSPTSSPSMGEVARRAGGGEATIYDSPELSPDAAALLAPYLAAVKSVNPEGGVKKYPGSPVIVRHLMRPQDRLSAIELHPQDFQRLKSRFAGDFQVRTIELDGWLALGAHLPPKEKRGLVLVDPPFEQEGEFDRLADGLVRAHRRWPGGIYALWYPIKDRAAVAQFRRELQETAIPRILDVAFEIRPPSHDERLDGSGLVVVNPPFVFEKEMRVLLPELKKALAEDPRARWSLDWIAGEDAPA